MRNICAVWDYTAKNVSPTLKTCALNGCDFKFLLSETAGIHWNAVGLWESEGLYSQISPQGARNQVWWQEREVGDLWASGQAGKKPEFKTF